MSHSRRYKEYQCTWSNGFVQTKQLITTDDWETILIPMKRAITQLESYNRNKPTPITINLNGVLNTLFGPDFGRFKQDSPMHKSIQTGVLDLPNRQGKHPVIWKRQKHQKG